MLGLDILPVIHVIDDDLHSARFLLDMLAKCGGPAATHLGAEYEGLMALRRSFELPGEIRPELLVVDLKSHSRAVLDFVERRGQWLRENGVQLAVMVPPTDHRGREEYYEAGVDAVFFRQPELEAYKREVAGIIGFWAQTQRLDAVGM
ncbi:MAG: hypothetical protein IR164_01255 [Devosia sp.]|uniref:hypothetical protein n=1 Tax=unclassified Devosia TaxID=196773 RepID=UPI0019E5A25E|nr:MULTISPECIES: hypothetical protein [unclassified Devosia]MBF0677549.1 hypothetical protein [Devosia sp.]WEJ34390.1 hypothetical protein NYQ88_06175 [Devosia sp. SD17-2]